MSWAYWGIVIGLAALVVMLVVCMTLLYSNGNRDRQGSKQRAGGPVNMPIPPSVTDRRAA